MNDFLKSIRFKILVAILTVMVGFMVASVYTGGTASFFSRIVSFATVPAQRFSANVSDSVSVFFDKFLRAGQTYEENKRLQNEINALREKLVDYDKIKHENEQLRDIVDVKEKQPNNEYLSASVIARDPNDRFYSFTIDKGTLDGVSYLDPVCTADGLIGYISEVGFHSAKVITLLDVTINVGAYSSATRDIGIVTGTVDLAAGGMCQIEYLPRDSKIEAGNIILTSGGAFFPKDIIIGTVQEVKTGEHGISLVATIRPAAEIKTVKDVFVITSFEGQGGDAP